MKALVVVVFALISGPAKAEILDEERLAKALTELPQTRLDLDTARHLVSVTVAAANDTDLDPIVLLAQTYVESRFHRTSTSRLIDGERHIGRWPSTKPPEGWHGTLYCGVTQTLALTWKRCLELREPEAAVTAQVAELRRWLKRTRGDLMQAFGGYGCGNAGLTHNCRNYAGRIMRVARKLRQAVRPLS